MASTSWLWSRHESLARRWVMAPLAGIYAGIARLNRKRWSSGLWRPRKLECCVVSVGSPVVGGAAKTPTAAWVARALKGRGFRVALATRGYGGRRRRGVTILGAEFTEEVPHDHIGDEALVLARGTPGVPVLVARDRGRAGIRAIERWDTEVLVLDDGLAHHRLARDVELVTLDASAGLGNGSVLPRGPLREPLDSISQIHAIGVVDGSLQRDDARLIANWAPKAFRYTAVRRAVAVSSLGSEDRQAPSSLAGLEVGLLSGLARPEAFEETVRGLGAHVVTRRDFPDHYRYRASDLKSLDLEASVWITTQKDAVKIRPDWLQGLDLRVLEIDLEIEAGAEFLDWLVARIRQTRTVSDRG